MGSGYRREWEDARGRDLYFLPVVRGGGGGTERSRRKWEKEIAV